MIGRYGSVALVTGASSGIGLAFAEHFAEKKLTVILVARRVERLEEIAANLRAKFGIRAEVIVSDLTSAGSGAAILAEVQKRGLSVDILVNNAGFGLMGNFEEHALARELEMVDLNCRAVVDLTHRFLPEMLGRKRGAILIVSSVVGVLPLPWFSTYCASKAFDLFFGESLAGELEGRGVDVLVVQPGLTKTEFSSNTGKEREYWNSGRTAAQVVNTAMSALGRRASVIDGHANWLLTVVTALLPRTFLRFVLRQAMRMQLR